MLGPARQLSYLLPGTLSIKNMRVRQDVKRLHMPSAPFGFKLAHIFLLKQQGKLFSSEKNVKQFCLLLS